MRAGDQVETRLRGGNNWLPAKVVELSTKKRVLGKKITSDRYVSVRLRDGTIVERPISDVRMLAPAAPAARHRVISLFREGV